MSGEHGGVAALSGCLWLYLNHCPCLLLSLQVAYKRAGSDATCVYRNMLRFSGSTGP